MSTAIDEESFLLDVGKRLAHERERLRLTQDQLGKLCGGITARTIISWEGGAKIPSHRLAMLIPAGIDVWYVLTGRKPPCDSIGSTCDSESVLNRTKSEQSIEESNGCYESHVEGAGRGKSAIRIAHDMADFLAELARLTPEQQAQALEFIREKRRLNELEAKVSALAARR